MNINKDMPGSQFNYSVGVLIVLLMAFWFVCKCIRPKQYTRKRRYKKHAKCKESMAGYADGGEMGYDSIPVIIDNTYGLPYIRNKDGKIMVPNSKHNIHNYYSDHVNRCSSTTTEYSELQTAKKRTEKNGPAQNGLKAVPSSATKISEQIERSDE